MIHGRGHHERHPTVRLGDRGQPRGRAGDHRLVQPADLVQHLERMERGGRLALGSANVGLERVAEPAIGVAVGAQRVEHRGDARAVEEDGEPVPVEQAGVGEDEPAGGVGVDRYPAKLRAAASASFVVLRGWGIVTMCAALSGRRFARARRGARALHSSARS
jgi:hypothetical protein